MHRNIVSYDDFGISVHNFILTLLSVLISEFLIKRVVCKVSPNIKKKPLFLVTILNSSECGEYAISFFKLINLYVYEVLFYIVSN